MDVFQGEIYLGWPVGMVGLALLGVKEGAAVGANVGAIVGVNVVGCALIGCICNKMDITITMVNGYDRGDKVGSFDIDIIRKINGD